MTDSWEMFAGALQEESAALARVHESAQKLTEALVRSPANEILAAERALDGARRAYQTLSAKRRGMQARGFGKMTLRQVCGYAPRRLAPALNQRLYELTTFSIGLRITANNNKALIAGGLDRLMKVTSALQKAANEGPKTYRRRGFVPPPTNSVLLSSRA
ncbi:MAG: hypothetical protein JO029_02125 [Candidatus Eremiobacteraeota bacterium]|nr:hypothetical protein [Candidatus Eremiobacteraeota bacterium]MBV8333814.1 hypothetical protein [Candidatus Eremiobacteraeota bacterium]MBV8433058.1 hypothetical protein [Candidatus Eremiobacteraeota bacterium]MBV8720603.1 hypothetical protein [Candidatus Eremiobacteraeota bacterium]